MPEHQSNALVKGAITLAVATLIVKILSAIYRIPFQNIVGDVGFYIYQQVYPFYGVALVLSTYGFPVVISKLYTERRSKGDNIGAKRLFVVSSIFMLILGIISFLSLFFGAEWLAKKMKDPELVPLLKMVAIVFLLLPLTALLRGFFQGRGNMIPTAYSQIGEQIVRVGTILFLSVFLLNMGSDLYFVGAGAVFGSVTGGIIAIIILVRFAWKDRTEWRTIHLRQLLYDKDSTVIIRNLVIQGFTICISGMLLIFMQLADSLNLYALLFTSIQDGGAVKELKGVYDRGQPLIQLGSVIATSMSLTLVPLISNEEIRTNAALLYEKVEVSLRISIAIGLGATVGLIAIIEPTNMMLFKNATGSEVLACLSVSILLSSVIITVVAILQGTGHIIFPAIIILAGFAIKYCLNSLLVPLYGTMGAALSTVSALLVIVIILYSKLRREIGRPLIHILFLLKVLFAAFLMYMVLQGYLYVTDYMYAIGHERIMASFQALSAVIIGGCTFFIVIIRTNVFTFEEWGMLPFGSKIHYLYGKGIRRGRNLE